MRAYAPIIGWLVLVFGGVAGLYLRKQYEERLVRARWLFATITCGIVVGLVALDAGSAYCCVSDGTDPARVTADRYARGH